MTKDEALKWALEALEGFYEYGYDRLECFEHITAIKEALAQPEQEPVYTHPVKEQDCYGDGNVYRGVRSKDSEVQTIYFNPVKELTDEEILEIASPMFEDTRYPSTALDFARAILRKAQNK